jgi:hypothetical protein
VVRQPACEEAGNRGTGTMVGLAAYDLHTQDAWATFDGFDYRSDPA